MKEDNDFIILPPPYPTPPGDGSVHMPEGYFSIGEVILHM